MLYVFPSTVICNAGLVKNVPFVSVSLIVNVLFITPSEKYGYLTVTLYSTVSLAVTESSPSTIVSPLPEISPPVTFTSSFFT